MSRLFQFFNKHKFLTCVLGLSIILSFHHHSNLGLGESTSSLTIVIIFFIFRALYLTAATYWIQQVKESKYLSHLKTSFFVFFYSIVFFVPIAAFMSPVFSDYGSNPINKIAAELPKIISNGIINVIGFVPIIFIASLVSYLLGKKSNENRRDITDHLIDD